MLQSKAIALVRPNCVLAKKEVINLALAAKAGLNYGSFLVEVPFKLWGNPFGLRQFLDKTRGVYLLTRTTVVLHLRSDQRSPTR